MIALMLAIALAEVGVEAPAVLDVPNVVVVTDAQGRPKGGETVRVIHRPGLRGEREIAIGITDGLGRVRWSPELPGVAEIRAGGDAMKLRIAWPTYPMDAVVLLALLLIAGAAAAGYGLFGRPGRS